MNSLNIELTQVESIDIAPIKSILSSDFRRFIDISKELTLKDVEDYTQSLNIENAYCFSIKAFKDNEYKKMVVGLCSILNIDWVNRSGNIFFVMIDKGGYSSTLQDHEPSKDAFRQLLQFGFGDLNLHKLSIEVFSGNDIMSVLEGFNFVAEGVRRSSKYKGGEYIDTTVCSIIEQDFVG